MSFFKKMKDKFEDLIGDDDDKDKKPEKDQKERHEGMHDICINTLQIDYRYCAEAVSSTDSICP